MRTVFHSWLPQHSVQKAFDFTNTWVTNCFIQHRCSSAEQPLRNTLFYQWLLVQALNGIVRRLQQHRCRVALVLIKESLWCAVTTCLFKRKSMPSE